MPKSDGHTLSLHARRLPASPPARATELEGAEEDEPLAGPAGAAGEQGGDAAAGGGDHVAPAAGEALPAKRRKAAAPAPVLRDSSTGFKCRVRLIPSPVCCDATTCTACVQPCVWRVILRHLAKQPVLALTPLDTLCDGCVATQVPGCALPEDVSTLKKVHQRARACPLHLQSLSLLEDGRALRFCQRCCKWEAVDAFEVRTRVAVVLNVRCVLCPNLEGTHLYKRPTHTRPLCLLQDGATAADCGKHTRAAMCCVLTARFPGGCRTTSGPASSRSPCTTSEGGPITRRPRIEDLLLVDECTQSLLCSLLR